MKDLSRRRLAPLALALLVSLTGCRIGTTIRTDGEIVNDRYVHPDGLFSMDVPALFSQGAVIEDEYADQMGSVSFRDDFGQLIRVDLLVAETVEQQAYLRDLDDRGDWRTPVEGMRDSTIGTIRGTGVEVELLDQEAVTIGAGGGAINALHFTLSLPGGSSMVSVSGLSRKRLDAYRFCLAFRTGPALYLLSSQHSIGLFGDPAQEAPYDEILGRHRFDLEALVGGMTFGGEQ